MRGIICERIGRFKMVDDLPEPVPAEGEAIIRIRRVGICGTDLHAFKGNQPFFSYPRILGHELAAVVERIGDNEAGLREGDQVSVIPYLHCGACIACRSGKANCCVEMKVLGVHLDGGMRERIAVPASHLIRTEGLTLDETAVLEPLAIGAHAVRRSGLQAGETALVVGAGPIGLAVMAFVKAAGARCIAMDLNEERLAFCERWAGADATVSALRQPQARIAELTDGDLPTAVFDATGSARSMTEAFSFVAHGGRLVYVGLVKADIAFHDPEFHRRELTLIGSRNATREDFDRVLRTVRGGSVDVGGYITHRAALDQTIESFEGWLRPESNVIKAMVEL
ncbi:zinc-binding alcohol dehydrogenase family protein [Cohnella nanjingensis]|uniref:Zinc-binding alcohol dehydrogenase family protein n=1 Tax=Cohnella nanjingensis TaxID=1387779 RepID=A0A7X0RYQ7_9BACL|nr:zinc-binding alcohol dehydrogenase family protein [Cohnella nanjingensis]MBB6674926.1 zinc-binding alcohol dehydrogenase family protein [Cohnella nanjingensis]